MLDFMSVSYWFFFWFKTSSSLPVQGGILSGLRNCASNVQHNSKTKTNWN